MATTLLRDRMRELMRLRNYSVRTEETYIERIADFARYFGRSPERIGPDDIHAYQVWLRDERHVSSSTFNLAAAALRFLYTKVLDRPERVEGLIGGRGVDWVDWGQVETRNKAPREEWRVTEGPWGPSKGKVEDKRRGVIASNLRAPFVALRLARHA